MAAHGHDGAIPAAELERNGLTRAAESFEAQLL
jgi:hypothetical protein